MKKLLILITLNILTGLVYSQTGESISMKLTDELEHIYSSGHINGFSVAIVNQNGLYIKTDLGTRI